MIISLGFLSWLRMVDGLMGFDRMVGLDGMLGLDGLMKSMHLLWRKRFWEEYEDSGVFSFF